MALNKILKNQESYNSGYLALMIVDYSIHIVGFLLVYRIQGAAVINAALIIAVILLQLKSVSKEAIARIVNLKFDPDSDYNHTNYLKEEVLT